MGSIFRDSYEHTDSSTEYTDHIIWKEFIKKVSSYIGINSMTKRAKKMIFREMLDYSLWDF